jgi:hypothetical protein
MGAPPRRFIDFSSLRGSVALGAEAAVPGPVFEIILKPIAPSSENQVIAIMPWHTHDQIT